MQMTAYNYTTDNPFEADKESMEGGLIPMSAYAREMQKNAIGQAKKAFENGREQIYSAMTVLNDVISYIRKEGLIALSHDNTFRGENPYVLDLIKEKEHGKVPLRQYLEFGLEHISCGETSELIEELMVNRYYVNSYAAEDAFTAYIYLIGVTRMMFGTSFDRLIDYFVSLIPDEEICTFNVFAGEIRKQNEAERYTYMCEKLEQKFKRWYADGGIVQTDKYSMATAFSELLNGMDDESMKKMLQKVSNMDLCCALLGADEDLLRHVMGLLSEKHRFGLMEDWMSIPFNGEAEEKCMEAMGRVVGIGMVMKKGV